MTTNEERRGRVRHANDVLKSISKHGRQFFFYEKTGRVSNFWLDATDELYYQDHYSDIMVVPTSERKSAWEGFTNGSTLKSLVLALTDYIQTGEPIDSGHFGPWGPEFNGRDLWGYGKEAMESLRAEVATNPAVGPFPSVEADEPVEDSNPSVAA